MPATITLEVEEDVMIKADVRKDYAGRPYVDVRIVERLGRGHTDTIATIRLTNAALADRFADVFSAMADGLRAAQAERTEGEGGEA
jgi:hypothetical protein